MQAILRRSRPKFWRRLRRAGNCHGSSEAFFGGCRVINGRVSLRFLLRENSKIDYDFVHVFLGCFLAEYCITPLVWVEIQCFVLTVYMPTCQACSFTWFALPCAHAYMHLRKCLHLRRWVPYPTGLTAVTGPQKSAPQKDSNWAPVGHHWDQVGLSL